MKYGLILLLVGLFLISCKDESTSSDNKMYTYKQKIFLLDSISGFVRDQSKVKVTILGSNDSTITDSSGYFSFTNLPLGIYSFVFEYKNYPKYYKYNVSVPVIDSISEKHTYIAFISSPPIHNFILDSISFGDVSYANYEVDSLIYIHYRRISPVPMNGFNQLVIVSKSSNSLDYSSGLFLISRAWIGGSIFTKSSDTLNSTFNYDSLKSWGFGKGDSVCFKFYPLNSVSYYVDQNTKREVYPYIGSASNSLAIKLW